MRLLLGNCLDKLKELDDNSVDSIVTDPPYGLSFMGKTWDYDVPSVDIWKECMRVLKPGGHLLSFAGSRTYHRMAVRIEDAGFEIRDQIMWIYGSGFPKSYNIGHKIDDYKGWGTALKPAHEPIVMARKPFKGSVAQNVLEWGTGGINIEDSRIKYDENNKPIPQLAQGKTQVNSSKTMFDGQSLNKSKTEAVIGGSLEGRFPANVIFDEEAGKILDEQSGITKSGDFTQKGQSSNTEQPGGWKTSNREFKVYKGDSGGASRFFYCPKTSKTDRNEGLDEFEDKYYAAGNQAKAELKRGNIEFNANKGKGRDERHNHNQVGVSKNNHPTVKPNDLMLYLIRLVTPKGGTTLDPFMGSGSTGKAAVRGGFDFVGIEMDKEYMEIATARIQYEIDNPYNEEKGERVKINKNANKFW